MRVTVLGATGVVGRALVPVLVARGHEVVGTTRHESRVPTIGRTGARGLICDGTSPDSVEAALAAAAPEVVVHLMTALPQSWGALRRGSPATDALRRAGTAHVVRSARRHDVRRVVAASLAFMYAPAPGAADEGDPLWTEGPRVLSRTYAAAHALEQQVVAGVPEGVVLRYGALYGEGTWYAADGDIAHRLRGRRLPVVGSGAGTVSFVHVDDAAAATVAAVEQPVPSGTVLNVVDDEPVTHRELLTSWASLEGWPRPLGVPRWSAYPAAGAAGVAVMTQQRGASGAAARAVLGWQPRYRSWRHGLPSQGRTGPGWSG